MMRSTSAWQTVWRLHGGARAPTQPFVTLRHLEDSESVHVVAGLVPGAYKMILYSWGEDAADGAAGKPQRKHDSVLASGGRSLLQLLSLGRLGKLEVRGELRVSALQAGARQDLLEHISTLSIDSRPSVEVCFEVPDECAAAEAELSLSGTSFMTPIKVSAQLYRRSSAEAGLAVAGADAEARASRGAGRKDAAEDTDGSADLIRLRAARMRARDRRARGVEAAAVFLGSLLGLSSCSVFEILLVVMCLLFAMVNAREDLLLSLVNNWRCKGAPVASPLRVASSDSFPDAGAGPAGPPQRADSSDSFPDAGAGSPPALARPHLKQA
jgi:hypothetical protein